ncbi:peptidase [Colwellia sp. MT41]|uniref:Sodium/hydrogen exchanger n=1 Tax=Colwellia marinimaniae TaxID=1513592 RepID=A0ABQ0MRV0_9GAMM|nr:MULTISPECIES: sodium:proton antiporter [Colwellia]ALO33477.1 peptidase [Colwellia sp. MT41]GAW95101.1 sodium/hydrogen exchanger [Colwellia marinimaniae]
MHFDTGILVLVFVVLSLIIGAITRDVLKNTPIPYSVALLVIGLALGLLQRSGIFAQYIPLMEQTVLMIAEVDPHLILWLFLPILIFESAFAMEVHLFRRIFSQIALLAVPGLMVATLLTAVLAKYAFPWDWSWPLCFMFGALISATDPVAVVALLRELSSRKRLETLIEGESLFNDGTAIVFFMLFLSMVVSPSEVNINPLFIAWDFLRVVFIGGFIGAFFGLIVIHWIGRIFNDPMIEITLSIVVSYLAFMVAEALHVSGVVAVVVLALMFASLGRTKISPEVSGFLHHFWEMMAHIANTIIFLLVGTLIAGRVQLDNSQMWFALLILYISVQVIRSLSVALFMPLLKRIGIGITREKAIVLVWGGLRGAVSLALALTVAQNELIPREIGDQILFLCAGIVVLTMLINGGSMGWLLKKLALNRLPEAKQATVDKASGEINKTLSAILPEMMADEFLKGANWPQVKKISGIHAVSIQTQVDKISEKELITAYQRRLLETERKHYWTQFEQGTLGEGATNKLVASVEHALDGTPTIAPRTELESLWQTPPLLNALKNIKTMKKFALKLSFNRLSLSYEVARGFIQAQSELKSHIDELAPNDIAAEDVHVMVEDNKKTTMCYITSLREAFPEIIHSLETYSACRLLLYRERAVITQQLKQAVLDKPEAERMIMAVEKRMAALNKATNIESSISGEQLIKQLAWLQKLPKSTQDKVNAIMQHSIYNSNEEITKAGKAFCALGIITRGTVELVREQDGKTITSVLGMGETVSAISLLSGFSADTIKATSLVDIIWLPGEKIKPILATEPELSQAIGKMMQ